MTNLEALKILQRIARRILLLDQALERNELHERGDADMPVSQEVATLISGFDAATDKIATRIQNLVNKSGLTAEEKSAFQAEIDKLNIMGQDPNNPLPSAVA